ncbi:cytosolic sulfotransferase 17-like [Panicum miliaceum]|uniref:Sulfotransferase n=1 Tax=Panicum miliaceum TaxID=4540 RepID=A0A3L6Q4U9_PANMI|nr:cytosolic sulfotransferase 17-like [Panicum miliaceum]
MATHMHHAILPASISNSPDCKIVYICRNPKDMLVFLWHFSRRVQPDLAFSDVFEQAREGVSFSGPIWDHVLGYWNASKESPETVLFLRYEEILLDPVGNVRKLARFETMRGLEVNRAAGSGSLLFPNGCYFRRGEAGDWANHMTPEMARRLDAVMEEKLRGSGLSFA